MREQLLAVDGVLVWVDPIHQGKTRAALDPLLRDVAAHGPWVSAHPDVIMKMGVKEVLYRTQHLGWGADTHLYRSAAELRAAFPVAAAVGGPARAQAEPRQWRARRLEGRTRFRRPARQIVRVLHAQRGSMPEDIQLAEFMARCEPYFAADG